MVPDPVFLNTTGVPYVVIFLRAGDVISIARYHPHFVVSMSEVTFSVSSNWCLDRSRDLVMHRQLFPAKLYDDDYIYDESGKCTQQNHDSY